MKQRYELMAIISSQITDQEIQKRLKDLKDLLGEVLFEEIWGIRPFAYRIKKHEKGHYSVFNFSVEGEKISELEASLRLFPDLLRYLLIRVPENYTPLKLSEIEEGLQKLQGEKAERRRGKMAKERSAAPDLRPLKAPPKVPVVLKKEESTPAPEKKKKSLDEKLQDIMSDDDLGL